MIEWCSYCQRYQGESPPFDDYAVTHEICDSCKERELFLDPAAVVEARQLAGFFERLRMAALSGTARADLLLAEAEHIGIRPLDFLVGMLQPVLNELGELWANRGLSVAIEHEFSLMAESVAVLVRQKLVASMPPGPSSSPEFLLVGADGNYHTLGLRIVEAELLSRGYSTHVSIPGLPAPEVVSLVQSLKPKVVGVSACLEADLASLRAIRTLLDELEPCERPRLVVGGQVIRRGHALDPALGFEACLDVRQLSSGGR